MGQCGTPICDFEPAPEHHSVNLRSYPSASVAAAHAQSLSPEDAARKIDQLDLELRMLKDDNFRLRGEQVSLERDLQDASLIRGGKKTSQLPSRSSVPTSASTRIDLEQQLTYMRELVRSLQTENAQLRSANGDVSEGEYRQLQQKAAQLQQAHLRQVQEARHLQMQVSASGTTTPTSQAPGRGSFGSLFAGCGGIMNGDAAAGSQSLRELQAQLQSLTNEQEALRGKVRRLAHNQ